MASKPLTLSRPPEATACQTKGLKVSLDEVRNLDFPFVVFWDSNHFLVVEGIDQSKDLVYLNDPAHGHRKITMAEFDQGYTGVALTFEPGPEFTKGGERPSLIKAVYQRLQHSGTAIHHLLSAGLLLTVPSLVLPAFTQIFLDRVLGEQRVNWLMPLVLAMGATVLFKILAEAAKFVFLRRLRIHLAISMASQFFWHLLRLPAGFYSQRYTGEIASRQGLNDGLAQTLSGRIADTVLSIVMMGFYLILMLYYNWVLTLIGVAFAAISFLALRLLRSKRVDANLRLRAGFWQSQWRFDLLPFNPWRRSKQQGKKRISFTAGRAVIPRQLTACRIWSCLPKRSACYP